MQITFVDAICVDFRMQELQNCVSQLYVRRVVETCNAVCANDVCLGDYSQTVTRYVMRANAKSRATSKELLLMVRSEVDLPVDECDANIEVFVNGNSDRKGK